MSSADQDLFDAWFRFADADRDNVIGGADAVAFFSRSGLPQETLFKVWECIGSFLRGGGELSRRGGSFLPLLHFDAD